MATRPTGGAGEKCTAVTPSHIDVVATTAPAAEILTENGIFIEAGPAQHNNSQGFYLYSYEPGGNRIEIYSGSYLVFAPDWEPVTWDEQAPAMGTYWGTALPDSFIKYGTPEIESDSQLRAPKLPIFF